MGRPNAPGAEPSRALRDLIVVTALTVAAFLVVLGTGAADVLERGLSALLHGSEDDVLLGFALLALGLGLLALLRWRDASAHLSARRAAEEQLRAVVEKIPAVTYTWDPSPDDGSTRVRYVSPQVEPILGFTVDEWTQDPDLWLRQIHPDDRDRVLAASERADRTGEPFTAEYRHRRPDGRYVWIHEDALAVGRGTRGPTLVQGVMYDVTARKTAEERLREAEERYRTLVERVPAVTYIWDPSYPDGRPYRYVSPQLEPLFGIAVEDWSRDAQAWTEHAHPDDAARISSSWDEANEAGMPFRAEYRIVRGDGSLAWVRDEAVPVSIDEQGLYTYQGVLVDITERKHAEERLREAEERYRAIVEHVPGAIYVDVPDGTMRTIYVSPQIQSILGVSPDEWLADPDLWLSIMHPEDREAMRRGYLEAVASGSAWCGEYRVLHPDGRWVWVHDETTFVHDDDGRPLFLQGVLFDITERRRAEETLVSSERREREAAERLRALDEMKNTFLAAVSHELRSPLTSILGLALTLQQSDVTTGDRRDLLERLATNARKLDRLLADLLDIDRLNRGIVTPQYRPIDLGDVVRRTIESLDVVEDRSPVLEIGHVEIRADPAKVERIVENLVVNGLRHTARTVRMWVRVEEAAGGGLIAVEDDGPGVAPELRREIFAPFRQGPTAAAHSPGTGIGLSLVSMFAELHGGRAWVEERGGGGASFRVFLPAVPPEEAGHEIEDPADGLAVATGDAG